MSINGIVIKKPCVQTCIVVKCWKWNISELFEYPKLKYAIVILNRALTQNQEVIKRLWNNASLRITVDGGTVHWDKFLNNLSETDQKMMKLPDIITGDFDSITPDVLEKFKKKGCKAIHTPDQNNTDFTKALIELNNFCSRNDIWMNHVIAMAETSGRIDHILGNIQTLHLVHEKYLLPPNTKVFLMSDDSLSWLLYTGDHIIDIPEQIRKARKVWCSLVPVGEICHQVTTTGLKWNLNNQLLKFGELVSTSNTYDGSEQVKIKCSHTLLWSMKIPCLTST